MGFNIKTYLETYTNASTLAFFRLAFGFMMVFSLMRFALYGWIDKLYIKPQFHFSYYGFEWVKPIGSYTYIIFLVCAIAAFFLAIGYKYKWSSILFFLSFTYIELMDKTTYLNHYYFISVVAFVMVFLPAAAFFSVDSYQNPNKAFHQVPVWTTDILKLLIGIVYFYAGLAKLNSDWMLHAMPLKIWLPDNLDFPVIGPLLHQNWLHYAFSWAGAAYDLGIVFLLLYKRTRWVAFVLVVIFHIATKILFPIGVFPFVMILSSLVFFDGGFHQKCLDAIAAFFKINQAVFQNAQSKMQYSGILYHLKLAIVSVFVIFQLLFPFRYLLYPGELFWTEEGYRFSWRVMLMEKGGYTQFTVTNPETKEKIRVVNSHFLTPFQEKQMSFQPDFILEYAHILHDFYQKQGVKNPQVRVESYVALNGRLSQLYIDKTIDLAKENESFKHKTWLLPFTDEIKGF